MIKYFSFAVFFTLIVAQNLNAGNFGEHKLIGDSAFKYYCHAHSDFADLLKQFLESEPLDINSSLIPLTNTDTGIFYRRSRYAGQYPLIILNGKAVTYGDLTALSGDHSPDFLENYSRFIRDTLFRVSNLFPKLFEDILSEYDKQLEDMNKGGRGINPVFLEFISLSIKDKSHFHLPAMPLRQEIDNIGLRAYDAANDLFYSGLTGDSFAIINRQKMLDFFEANSTAKYTILHMMAKTYYIHVLEQLVQLKKNMELANKLLQKINSGDKNEDLANNYAHRLKIINQNRELAKKFLLLTLFTNAFSEHYLQDMFAAGHFFPDRHVFDLLGLEAKGIHDYFGRHGVVTIVQGKPDTLLGDGRYTPQQCNMAVEANIASLEDLFNVDVNQPRKPGEDYLRMLRTPTQEPSQLFPALKKIPDVPLGERYSSQRENIGRSISGLYYGLYGLGSSDFLGGGLTTGLNYLLLPPTHDSPVEGRLGFGFNFLFEVTSDKRIDTQETHGRLGLGFNLLFYDWVYGNASITSGIPVGVRGRFEGGIQIKPRKWDYGFRIGIVKYASSISSDPQLSISIIHY